MVSLSAISDFIRMSRILCWKCSKSRRLKSLSSSYFMHEITVVVLLLSCVGVTFGLGTKQAEPGTRRSAQEFISSNVAASLTENEGRKILQDPATKEVLKDAKSLEAESKGLFFGEDTNGVPIVVGTWFRYGSYTLAFAMFGTAFLVACAASAVYYVLFVVTEPSQQVRSANSRNEGWNFGRVLRALQLAYETYETFDPYSSSCQLKTVCEIQESKHFQGSVLKRMAHFVIHTDIIQKKLESAEELLLADRIGNDPKQQCGEKFESCRFSLGKLYENYVTI